jgi:hypothetical protein
MNFVKNDLYMVLIYGKNRTDTILASCVILWESLFFQPARGGIILIAWTCKKMSGKNLNFLRIFFSYKI